MSEPASARYPLGLPVSSTPSDSEEGRQFFQQRLALLAKLTFLLSAFFFVFGNTLALLMPGVTFWMLPSHGPNGFHLAGQSVSLVVWLVTRRGAVSRRWLRRLDAGLLLGALATYSAMTSLARSGFELSRQRMDLIMMMIAMLMLSARAIIVPSSPRRTFAIGALGSSFVLVTGWMVARDTRIIPGVVGELVQIGYLSLWCAAAIAVTTVASHVIYGLRKQVAEAQQLGQYVLDEKIGQGGMGAVYRARHALLRRPTAIKLILQGRAGVVDLTRFEREVQLTSRLTHPNTVAIFDYGRTPDGVFYYAMEYLEGLDLARLVELAGPQPPARVVRILEQICGALSEAHGIGLVHRDIKPANIILCERGGVPDVAKIVDFGLVKDVAGGEPGLSNVDTLIGTPLFMPPEALLTPDKVDARSDIYSLGGVAYHLLTGAPMFSGTVMEVCSKHLHQAPESPSMRLGTPLPPELEQLVLACLEKQPDKRPQSAREMLERLRRCALPRWTEEQARTWWAEHPGALEKPRRQANPPQRSSSGAFAASAITVDVRRRALQS